MDYKDYYKTLGVNRKASQDEIRKTFRDLARKYHPDVNEGDKQAEEKFKEINEAYQVLSDPDKRQKYDQFGSQWQQFSRAGGRPDDFDWSRWGGSPGGQRTTINMEDLQDILGQGFGGTGGVGGFSDFFETLFGGGSRRQTRSRRGQDVEQGVEITLEEAFSGTTRAFQRDDGSRFEVKIPRGVKTGSKVRISGKGSPGFTGGQAGNLYLKVKVRPHPTFKRKKDNLELNVPIDLYTALLGGRVKIQTLERAVMLTIPPETSNDKVIRLRGLGMPSLRNPEKRGDLLARIEVQLPKDLTEEEKELILKLKYLRD